jgi:hypothetical protein
MWINLVISGVDVDYGTAERLTTAVIAEIADARSVDAFEAIHSSASDFSCEHGIHLPDQVGTKPR